MTDGRERPVNLAVLMRDGFKALNDRVLHRLAAEGHEAVRPAHSAVFEFLDETGTTVSALADRAQMTKQGMAELVRHLEEHGYVTREPDPDDRRAKLVLLTPAGREVVRIAQRLVPELEQQVADLVGPERARALREDLTAIGRLGATDP
ncbi:MarR family transcriptional regulator [Actinomycetospora lutea]|uniref:MarR family winged helix-turn-helix transcriptional regulator n=1 Tax=Actinomycetospora lutea TaxID=663604 RepID=UPI00236693D0|nr:MarR family transcriptional regulator [Actinomycetospora lutea]MDD7939211.1 MarR family transcriptional regulator [Actinomycetospora lutea]